MPTLKAGKTQGGPVFLLRMPVWLRPKCHSRRWLNLHMRLVSHVSHPNAIHVQACVLQYMYLYVYLHHSPSMALTSSDCSSLAVMTPRILERTDNWPFL